MLTSLTAWMKRLTTRVKGEPGRRSRSAPRQPRRRYALRVETLEDRVCPSAFDATDLLVITNNTLREYTTAGALVQSFDIPYPGGRPGTESARGVTVGQDGQAYVYNGTFNPYLSGLDPTAGTWSDTTYPGWSTVATVGYGGVARYQQYIFASDMNTAGAPENGIIRFNPAEGTAVRFGDTRDFRTVSVGLDGNVYGIESAQIDVYDPISLDLLRTLTVPSSPDPRGVAVDASGDIFTSDWNGYVYHFDASGNLINSLNTTPLVGGLGINNLTNIGVSATGNLAITGDSGYVIYTDESFTSPTVFHADNNSLDTFVVFVHPEVIQTVGEIHGTVYVDQNGSGVHHPGDPGQPGVTVFLDLNNNGVLDTVSAEPDNFADGTVLTHAIAGLTLSVADANNTPSTFFTVQAQTDPIHSTGTKVFSESGVDFWTSDFRFRADMDQPAYTVSLDFISSGFIDPQSGIMLAYDASGNLLDTYTTAELGANQVETMTINRPQGDIAYVVAYTNTGSFGRLDNLRVIDEPNTVTDANGNYSFTNLQPGNYVVREVAPAGFQQTQPGNAVYYGAAYAGTTGQTQLVQIDAATGQVTRIGDPMAVRMHGLVRTNDGSLYGINGFDNSFYAVDPNTGQVTLIGATGYQLVWALTYDPSTDTIYGLARTDPINNINSLVSFDRTTGAVTVIGNGIGGLTGTSGLAFDAANNRILAFDNADATFYAFDATTGAGTRLATASPAVHGWDMAFNGQYAVIQALGVDDNMVLEYFNPDTGELVGTLTLSESTTVEALTFVVTNPFSYSVTVTAGAVITGLDFGNRPLN
jgi:hypothetical protein